jgi:hypothetical protein
MGHLTDPTWPYGGWGGDSWFYSFNPELLLDCAPTPLHEKDVRAAVATIDQLRTVLREPRPSVDLRKRDGQADHARLWGPVRGNPNKVENLDENSVTCNAVLDAVQYQLRRAGLLEATDELAAEFVTRFSRRPIFKWETTSLFHTLLWPRAQGVVTRRELDRYYGELAELNEHKRRKDPHETFSTSKLMHAAHERTIEQIVLVDDAANAAANPDRWRSWLSSKGPLLVRLVPDQSFVDNKGSLEKYDEDAILFRGPDGRPANAQTAALLVGYTGCQNGRFILRNVWGRSWGEDGHAELSEDYARRAITEAWGIHVETAGAGAHHH